MKKFGFLFIFSLVMASCTTSSPLKTTAQNPIPTNPETIEPNSTVITVETEILEPSDIPSLTPLSPEPQRIEFRTSDGRVLVGRYFPAKVNPAPVVVLMHWAGGNKSDWEIIGMTTWLINLNGNHGGEGLLSRNEPSFLPYTFPEMPDELSFAVFTFDFRGFGESGNDANSVDPESWILDASAAYEIASSLPGIDQERIVGIGASIGADGVVDGCGKVCLGALSISPGNFLKQSYEMTVKELNERSIKTVCIAAEDDPGSVVECKKVRGISEMVINYPAGGHGMMLFDNKLSLDPNIGMVIQDFLFDIFGVVQN
jgi:dienelactone hydrolase